MFSVMQKGTREGKVKGDNRLNKESVSFFWAHSV